MAAFGQMHHPIDKLHLTPFLFGINFFLGTIWYDCWGGAGDGKTGGSDAVTTVLRVLPKKSVFSPVCPSFSASVDSSIHRPARGKSSWIAVSGCICTANPKGQRVISYRAQLEMSHLPACAGASAGVAHSCEGQEK